MCQIKKERNWSQNTKLTIIFFASILAIAAASTIIDLLHSNPNELLVSFSLWKNSKALFSLDRSPSDVSTIHGIRFINAGLLLISHKSMAVFYNPHTNQTQMIEQIGEYISVIARAAAIYTDAFIMLSGLLTSYAIIGRLKNNQSPRIGQEYFSRFLRIVPTLGALILFCTFILPELGAGPQWNLVVEQHADICKENWWKNFLFVHNYFGFGKMCLTHTHHLGIDTQLFVLSPILILILWKWPKMGSIGLLSVAVFSTGARFYVTIAHQLSNYVYFGASIKQLFRTADLMYSMPLHRATIYIFGIFVGYAMRMYKHVKLSKSQLIYGWSISILMLSIVLIGPAKMGNMNYKYNPYDAAFYAAFSPMSWCTIFAWIIFTTHIGYSSFISEILSCRLFLVTTRLAYAIYLTQFPIFFYNVGTTKHSGFYNFITTNGNIYEILFIIAVSVILTLLFDTPFQNIKKYIFDKKKPTVITNNNEKEFTISNKDN
ncbi:nose resistant to fluoxetine protein 6-like [Contarinia nasturtii]|nr:nose resistant to fluoxetine protein 6-like [Contarinia nasturtii]